MRRILLVAEGTMDKPLLNVTSIVAGVTVTVGVGMTIINLGLSTAVTILLLVTLLVAVALIKGRFGGPREFRVEKPVDGDSLRVTGRFANGEIPVKGARTLRAARMEGDRMVFATTGPDGDADYHIEAPAFSTDSMRMLCDEIDHLAEASIEDVQRRHASGNGDIRFYDAKQLVLLRFTQKPSYMAILWLVSGATVLGLLLVGSLFVR